MGERGILGIAYNTRLNSLIESLRAPEGCEAIYYLRLLRSLRSLAMTAWFLGALFFSSCTPIPKFIILHDPLTLDEHLSLGLSYELKEEFDYAIEEYSKALKVAKKDYRPLFYLGNVYYKKREYGLAESYYRKALRKTSEEGDIHNNLAWVYIDTAKLEEAEKEVNIALKIKRDPYYMDTLANIYAKMGMYEKAIEVLQEAISITPPGDTDLLNNEHRLLGDLYERLNSSRNKPD